MSRETLDVAVIACHPDHGAWHKVFCPREGDDVFPKRQFNGHLNACGHAPHATGHCSRNMDSCAALMPVSWHEYLKKQVMGCFRSQISGK